MYADQFCISCPFTVDCKHADQRKQTLPTTQRFVLVAYYHCSDIVSFLFHVSGVLSDLLVTRLLLVNLSSDQIIVYKLG